MSILQHVLKGSECLCGAFKFIVQNIGAWNQKVGHPCARWSLDLQNVSPALYFSFVLNPATCLVKSIIRKAW